MSEPHSLPIAASDAGYWVHALSPFAVRFTDTVGIRWYGLAYLAGLAWGFWMLSRWSRSGRAPLRTAEIGDFILAAGLGMIIGGRLGFCFLYAWPEVLANPFGHLAAYDVTARAFVPQGMHAVAGHEIQQRFDPPFIVKVWDGGMASHGGMIGLAAGCCLFAYRRQRNVLVLADLIAATGGMGIGLGRIANFINGELWGRPSHVPWAVIFPDVPLVGGYAVPRHPSQLYAAVLEGFLLLAIILPIHRRVRRPGFIVGLFLALYAFARITDECWREADPGQPGAPGVPAIFGVLSKGQAYSLPLLVIGCVVAVWAWRRGSRPNAYALPSEGVSLLAPSIPSVSVPRDHGVR